MNLITVNGKKYKSPYVCKDDTVQRLNYTFVRRGLISKEEYTLSKQKIIERFELDFKEEYIDARRKEYKDIPFFSWAYLPFKD